MVKRRVKTNRGIYPQTLEDDFAAALKRRAREATRSIKRLLDGDDDTGIRFDSTATDLARAESVIGRVRLAYYERFNELTNADLVDTTARKVVGYVDRQVLRQARGVLGVKVYENEAAENAADIPALERAMLITNVETFGEHFFFNVSADVREALKGGGRWEQLSGVLQDRYNMTAKRANLIARDQMGALVSTVNRRKQEQAGASKYIWRTSEDERVVGAPGNKSKPNDKHGDHYVRNGETFSWNNPPHDGHPGMAINCRCTAEPVFDEIPDDVVDIEKPKPKPRPKPKPKPKPASTDPFSDWERKPKKKTKVPTDAQIDKQLDKATKYWNKQFDGLNDEERAKAFKKLHTKLHSNKYDLTETLDLNIVMGKANKVRTAKVYEEIGNLVGEAVMGDRIATYDHTEPIHGANPSGMRFLRLSREDLNRLEIRKVANRAYHAPKNREVMGHAETTALGARFGYKQSPLINVGDFYTKGGAAGQAEFRETQFHEFGHLIEYRNPNIFAASKRLLEKRTENAPIKDLGGAMRGEKYRDGGFYNPYVGKDYFDRGGERRATEILSMGLEKFTTPENMEFLQRKDPEHFAHIMNVISGEYGYSTPDLSNP